MIREIPDFVKCGRPPVAVTAVAPYAVNAFLGARNERERNAHLRDLRDRGLLIHNKRGLQQKLRGGMMAYVFKGTADQVPKIRGRVLPVMTWR